MQKLSFLVGQLYFQKDQSFIYLINGPLILLKQKKLSVWDLKGNKYLDMFCAVGTSILGYTNSNVNKSVSDMIKKAI